LQGNQHVPIELWDRLQEREPVSVQYLASSPSTNRLAGEQGAGLEYIFGGVGTIALLIGLALLGRLVWRRPVAA
jgi:hypothetical protein